MRTLVEDPIDATRLFGSLVCVAEPTEPGAEAVRQAARLAAGGARLELIESPGDATAVLGRCHGRDLLVVPAGPLAATVLPQATMPVLVARSPAYGGELLDSVLIAVDGSPGSRAAARLGARLAARERTALALVATPEHDGPHRDALEQDVAEVERATGRRPLILDEYGPPAASIVQAAASLEATVIVLGSRPGRPAASVSAEVAERAGCSVLVLRPGDAGRRRTTEREPSSARMRP
jgi:nucleotide-binding universal stress UspA family protein